MVGKYIDVYIIYTYIKFFKWEKGGLQNKY